MKKKACFVILIASFLLSAFQGCKPTPVAEPLGPDAFVIEGQLPENRFDSACLYLVPMQGPHPRPVDSTFVGSDGKFRFEGNVEQIAVIRLAWRQRYGVQELLVVTEPGVIHVTLDSISSSYGTPQNDALQQWKKHREEIGKIQANFLAMRRELGSENEQFKQQYEAYREAEGEYNYQFLKKQGRNTLSVFLFKRFNGKLDSLRHAELQEMLVDTIDYTKPQPGFRK